MAPRQISKIVSAAVLVSLLSGVTHDAAAERLPVRIYTSADGLGSSYVSYLMRDSRGFLWFCTRDGLSRFDGSRFVTYQVGGKNAPPGIEQIIETRKGIYWIATTGGLYRFDPNANLVVPQPTGGGRATLNAEMVSASRGVLYEDRAGNLWIGARGLYRLEEQDGKVVWQKIELNLPEHRTAGFAISAFCEGKDGSLWVVTNWGLLRRLADGREVFYSIEPGRVGALASVLEDHRGCIWLTSQSGIYIIKPESMAEMAQLGALTIRKLDNLAEVQTSRKEIRQPEKSGEIRKYAAIEGLDNSSIKYLYETADGHIWIAGGTGPIEFDGRSFHPYTGAQGLAAGLGQVVEDLSGNLWLGGPNGLARLNRKGLTTYDAADGLRDTPIDIVSEGREGKLYAASEGFFISQFDGHGFHTIRPQLPANARAQWTSNYAFLDSRNEWWFLTSEGLHRFAAPPNISALAQARPLATYTSRDGLKSNVLFHIFEDSKGDLWISTRGASSAQYGLSRWNRATDEFYSFSAAEGFPSNKSPSSFAEDSGGNLWFGFYQGGLARYRDGRFTEFTTKDGLPDGMITALHLDQSGRIWVALALGGLSRIDNLAASRPSFVTHTIDNGLASNNVRCLTEDLYGNVYAGTARGIDRLSADGLHIKHYSVNDGLAGDFVYAGFRDRNGVLWFGTSSGLSRLAPQPDKQTPAPNVWLDGLRIAGESRAVPELGGVEISDLELAPTQNNLQIDFFGIDFNPGETLRYQYMLEGADRDWSALTEQRTVNYANLGPGSYRYLVRAVNADGVASPRPASVSFRVLSPIWWRWWFILSSLILIAVPIVVVLRYRYQRMKAVLEAEEALRRSREERLIELERVRTRIATDLHDDIGSSLTQIAILSEVTRQRVDSGADEKGSEPLARIISVANELVDTMSDIVWAINPNKDHLSDLLQRMRRFVSDIFTARNIAFRFRASDQEHDIELGANVRREVFLIFKESVNNVVKHSGCTRAEIDFQIEGEWITLKVADNGKGFDSTLAVGGSAPFSSPARGGNGLMSMRKRAEEMGGQFEIVSRIGEGTTVTLRVLTGSARF